MRKIAILKTARLLLKLVVPSLLILNIYVEMTNYFDYSYFNETFIRSNLILEQERKWGRKNFAQYAYRNYDEPLQACAENASLIIERFINYVDTIHADLDKTVPYNTQWRLWNPKNDAFVSKIPQATQLKVKIAETHQQLMSVLESIHSLISSKGGKPNEEIKQMQENLLLKIDENEAITNRKRSWEAFTFGDMSVAACHTMLSKIQNDALMDEIRMRNYLSSKIGGCCFCLDKFTIISEPQKNYVWEGERFQTKISLTSSSRENFPYDLCYFIDSTPMPIKNEKIIFEATTQEAGEKSYAVDIIAQIPFHPEIWHYSKTFKYQVIQPFFNCAADKMNTIYIGVENPISVRAAGLSSNEMQVSATNCVLKSTGVGKFIATATTQGIAKITVATKDWQKTFTFRVKLPPNPVPMLNLKKSGEIAQSEMKVQNRISLEANDLDIKYAIQSFTLVRVPHSARARPVKTVVKSGVFDAAALQLVAAAEGGDWYYFEDIKINCPLNNQVIEIAGMNFFVIP